MQLAWGYNFTRHDVHPSCDDYNCHPETTPLHEAIGPAVQDIINKVNHVPDQTV